MSLSDIPVALEALRAGRPIIVADDEGRENEGDVIIAAESASQEWVAWMVRNTSGYVCAPMTNQIADRLGLPLMWEKNEDWRGTAYTVSVDAADRLSTGISASDRAHTLRVLADPAAKPASLIRPGHILPLRAVDGGVRERDGHTEAAVDLLKLAGLTPVAAIAEIVDDDGEMMRLPNLIKLGEREDVPVITIEALLRFMEEKRCEADPTAVVEIPESSRVTFEVETTVPTEHGAFRVRAYRDRSTGADHVAWIAPDRDGNPPADGTLIRVHSECLTGEAFGSLKCECGPQLQSALDTIEAEGGVVIYLRGHEGRGIGLINKLKAYRLQEEGFDTLDANIALGLPADARDYGAATGILKDLGISRVKLLSNNPEKARQLEERGVVVTDLVPLVVGVGEFNEGYLDAKRDRMGHDLPKHEVLTKTIQNAIDQNDKDRVVSGEGQPDLDTDGTGLKITIVSGLWHNKIADGLLAGAHRVLDASGAEVTVVQVPGSFELPVAAKVALENGADAVVALGVIVRGGTPHFEYVSAAATDGLTRVALDTGKAVGFGVLTLDDEQQGLDRAGLPGSKEDKGAEAAQAALAMARILKGLRA